MFCVIANHKYCIHVCLGDTYIAMQVNIHRHMHDGEPRNRGKGLGQHNNTLLYSVQLNCVSFMTTILRSSL